MNDRIKVSTTARQLNSTSCYDHCPPHPSGCTLFFLVVVYRLGFTIPIGLRNLYVKITTVESGVAKTHIEELLAKGP